MSRPSYAIAGATGFVGRRLVRRLLDREGADVRCLVRDAERGREVLGRDVKLVGVDVETDASALTGALEGCSHAYFLVHLMGGKSNGYAERERRSGEQFGRAASAAGVAGMSYLGGLGGHSPHLRSRQHTAEALAEHGPPLTYFRAGMIVGPGSESFELLHSIITQLRIAPVPSWFANKTQPIGIRDAIAYLAQAPTTVGAAGREAQIGGPDVLSYSGVIDELAAQMGRSGPRWVGIADRIASPGTMAAGAATLTRGDPAVAAELALGLQEDTVVTDPSGAELFAVNPEPIGVVFQRCLEEIERNEERAR